MGRSDHIDDAVIEALLSGNGAGDELPSLAAFAGELRSLATGPVPVPSAELAAMLAHGFSPDGGAPAAATPDGGRRLRPAGPRERRRSPVGRYLAGLNVAFKAAFSAALALAGVTAAGAAGALPGPAQRVVSTAVEAVTPFEFPEEAGRSGGKADFGERVSTDATDGGVDGREVSEDARNHDSGGGDGGGRPEAPGQAGLDQAGGTPAAGHPPSSVPGGMPDSAGPPGAAGAPADAGPPPGGAPATLPAVPLSSVPPPGPVPGDVTGATPTLPPLPGTVPTTAPRSIPPPGGLRR